MRGVRLLLLAILVIAAPGLALAQGAPKWSYIQAGYIDFDPDEGSGEDGVFAGGSLKLFRMFHVLAEYDDVGDLELWSAGFGWHGLLGEKADLFVDAVWADYDADEGYAVDAGLRWKILDWLEVNGRGRWLNLDEADSDALIRVGALATFWKDRLGAGADVEIGDADTLRVYARFSFGG